MSFDLHVHTTFSDGKNTPEEIVLEAIRRGMDTIGFSDHSYTRFDESYCMKKERIEEYIHTVRALKEKYRDRIRVLLGIEQDLYSAEPTDRYDYVIASVHYLKIGETFVEVDWSPEIQKETAKTYFGGDFYQMIEAYFETVALIPQKLRADYIGHFDLISKYNEKEALFSEDDPRYLKPAFRAVDALIRSGNRVFEINTGAMARGYKTVPYPSDKLRRYIEQQGGRFILSSDSHKKETLCYAFSEYQSEVKEFLTYGQ